MTECSAAINAHIVAKATSDGQGRAKFENVKPGHYYLMAAYLHRISKQVLCWEYQVVVAAGKRVSVTLHTGNVSSWGQ